MRSCVRPYVVTRIEATTVSKDNCGLRTLDMSSVCSTRQGQVADRGLNGAHASRLRREAFAAAVVGSAIFMSLIAPLAAQEPPSAEDIEKVRQVQKDAETIGSWDQQYMIIEQAADNMFQQQGWSSESDQYARSLMRDIGRIPPWEPQKRQELFMGSLQTRYGLSDDQRTSLNGEIQREAMMVTAKNFRDILPVAMEVVKTRANGEPFTSEQVQRWSKALKPLMNDSLAAMQRVTDNMKKDMTPEQRKLLEADVEALTKRHRDVEKMMVRWEAGQWTPTDWGLQDDPIHYSTASADAAKNAEKDALVQQAVDGKQPLNEAAAATDESEWDRYVRQFCEKYGCTDSQRASAQGILKNSKQEAISFRNARREQIAQIEKLLQAADTPDKRKAHQDELQRQLAPITDIFNRMKSRLYEQVLTTEQRKKFPMEPAAQPHAAKPARVPSAPVPAAASSQPAPQAPPQAAPPQPASTSQPAPTPVPPASQPASPAPASQVGR